MRLNLLLAMLLLGAAAHAEITITRADGAICTDGTIHVNGAVTPVDASCSAPATPPGACGTLPANTKVVDTGGLDSAWRQQMFFPLPQTVTAFKIKVPSGYNLGGDVVVTKTSFAIRSKLVVVSECPGVLEPVGGQAACAIYQLESTRIRLSTTQHVYHCKLEPGRTYYANVVSKVRLTDSGYTCTNTTDCSFLASRGAPY